MAWIKIPAEHHPLFREALPRDGRIAVIRMFGGLAAMCRGNLFAGLFARSIIVRLSPEHHAEALALDGTAPFDPMGNGRVMTSTLLLPEDVMEDSAEVRRWLERAFRHTLTLPPKVKKAKPAKSPAKPAKPAKAPARQAKASTRHARATAKAAKPPAKPVKAMKAPAKPAPAPKKPAAKAKAPPARKAPATRTARSSRSRRSTTRRR